MTNLRNLNEPALLHTMGWKQNPTNGKHVYFAPNGSVDASGPTTDNLTPGGPLKPQAAMEYGFPRIPQDTAGIRGAASAIDAFYTIFPLRSDIPAASLGILFAAPLAMSRRGSVGFLGGPGSGKTVALSAIQAFTTGIVFRDRFTGGSITQLTSTKAFSKAAAAGHSLLAWDDYEECANERIRMVMASIVKAAYGESGSIGNLQTGGLRAPLLAHSVAIFTAEDAPSSAGIASRFVALEFDNESVALSSYDLFKDFASRGNELYGRYIQWLAFQIDAVGLQAFAQANDEVARDWARQTVSGEVSGRAAGLAGMLGAGWMRFREFASEVGISDLLPADDEVRKAIVSTIPTNK
ncbi:MAG: hypothetical protein JWM49_634 [Microbacteriaceae bacterium]|nr:hypothetical protein [Microbacteriaceae bacterium]